MNNISKITPEKFIGNSKVTFLTGNDMPEKGTPEYFSIVADSKKTKKAHLEAIKAWEKYPARNFNAALLKTARIRDHEKAIQELKV